MNRNRVGTILVLAIVAAVIAALLIPWGGQRAPDVTFNTLEDESYQLADLTERGPVLITFWATTCGTCITEMPYWQAFHDELSEHGLTIVGVAMEYDPIDDVRRMVEARELPYTIAPDRDGAIARAFGDVRYTPTTALIGTDGRIVWKREGRLNMERLATELSEMTGAELNGERLATAVN